MVLDAGAVTSIPTFRDGVTPLHAASASAGFHPTILPELLKNTSSSDLDAKDFSGRTALHYAAGINIQSYARLVSDRINFTSGAIPKHCRLHTSSIEEAFMPSTRAEVETWLQSWTAHFAGESDLSESDSDEVDMQSGDLTTPTSNESDSTTTTCNEKVVIRLARKIKATMMVWLIGSGASISQKDSRGKKSLDIVLETGFAESLDVIDTHGLRKVSQALIALGAKQTDSYQLLALDIALMRGHLITVRGIIHEDAAITKISKTDHRYLSSFVNQDSHPRKDLSSTNEPQTPLAALHTAFVLRCCLKKYSRSSGYDESIHNKISTLIVDFAEYWVETSDTVRAWDEEHYRRRLYQVWGVKVGAHVPLANGELRKIEICVINSGYKASGSRRFLNAYSDISFEIRNAEEFEEAAPKLPSASILEVIRRPTELIEAFLLKSRKEAGEREETIKIPSGGFQCHDYGGTWEQVWYLPSSIRNGVSVIDEEISKWLTSLSARDTIILRPTQDFFAHDVALYGGFGLKIYSAWI